MSYPDFTQINYSSNIEKRDKGTNIIATIGNLNTAAGFPPFLRGSYASMYLGRPWTIRQYAGFSTAEESNAFYCSCIAKGQMGLSVAFDLPTHRGYDSDHPRVAGDVGKAGVAIDTVEDMKRLFKNIALDKVSVSMTMNGAVLPIMAFFIVAAEEQNVSSHQLRGTIQNDILKEFMVRNTYIYPPKPSMHIIGDIFEYCVNTMPKFNAISVSGYHIHEASASADIELAYTLANGLEYVRTAIKRGIDIDHIAPRISFFFAIGMNFFEEIAKLRAARLLWTKEMQQFKPKNPRSLCLRTHCQTSGASLTAQKPQNNIIRTCVESIAAVCGHTQSLHTNAFDEALTLPTIESSRIARNTQLFLQHEAHLTNIIDPWGGSYHIESLTNQLYTKASKIIKYIDKMGGMISFIESGYPKQMIEKQAAQKQARIEKNEDIIVGVNAYKSTQETEIETLAIDDKTVMKKQFEQLQKIRQSRNTTHVDYLLKQLTQAAKTKKENLLELAIKAAKERATLGEISLALEKSWGRNVITIPIVKGEYAKIMHDSKEINDLRNMTLRFYNIEGRRPRILISKLGQDGHDRGARVVAHAFADMGFDVDVAPLFLTPREAAQQAIENDVHIIGISSLAAGHNHLVPELIKALKKYGRDNILVVVGGIVPSKDIPFLKKCGVYAIFGSGTPITLSAKKILDQLFRIYHIS